MPGKREKHTSDRDISSTATKELSRYDEVILEIFLHHYQEGANRLEFKKDELAEVCRRR